MGNWRWWLLGILTAAPFLFLIGYGAFQLWWTGWFFWAWWPMAGCLVIAFVLAWRWQKGRRLLSVDFEPALHWTERDRDAWRVVEARAQKADTIPVKNLTSFSFYAAEAESLTRELAVFYHPGAQDPIGSLTILEILGVIELAAHDLALMLEKYIPGSHFMTIDNWRKAQQAIGWYQRASKVGWLVASVFNPLATGARYLATQIGVNKPWQKFQENLQLWFYNLFLTRVGSYLIELYGGRLRRGATRYRQLFGTPPDGPPSPEIANRPITIAVIGQTKTGKSSLINALLGERQAQTDVVKSTDQITRYELHPEGVEGRLVLLDTVGYANEGPREDQLRATENAARVSDILVLTLHARNPARQADLELLDKLARFFADKPELKKPPILAVVTHIDLLSPAMEWSPPYDWKAAKKPKEKNIAAALENVREQLGDFLMGVVPVCAAPGKEFGIEESLLPALTSLLDEGRAVSLVRCLRAEADSGNVKKTLNQLLEAGSGIFRAWFGSAQK